MREKEYEPRYFIGVRMLIVWRREEDYLRAAPLMALSAGKVSVPSLRRASPPPRATSGECRISRLLPTSRKKPAQGGFFCVAQRRGFEPPDESPPSHDFQSCSLNHSDISASDMCYFTTNARKKQLLFVAFFIFFARRANIFSALLSFVSRSILEVCEIFYKIVKIFFRRLLPNREKCGILSSIYM